MYAAGQHYKAVLCICEHPFVKGLKVTGGLDNRILLHTETTTLITSDETCVSRGIKAMTWSYGGRWLVVASYDGLVRIFTTEQAHTAAELTRESFSSKWFVLGVIRVNKQELKSLAVSPTNYLAVTCRDKSVWVYDLKGLQANPCPVLYEELPITYPNDTSGALPVVTILNRHHGDVKTCCFVNERLVTAGYDGRILLHTGGDEDWESRELFRDDTTNIVKLLSNPMMAITTDGKVLMYNDTGVLKNDLDIGTSYVSCAGFANERLYCGSVEGDLFKFHWPSLALEEKVNCGNSVTAIFCGDQVSVGLINGDLIAVDSASISRKKSFQDND